jgi:glycine/D-amino acid oxidase-like deaminating enzyme
VSGPTFWLEQALAAEPESQPCPPLVAQASADVCVVGGGYTGLWTAIELKRRSPELRVVLLEAQVCGMGASGRNGGWATSWYDELDRLVARFGTDAGLWLADESSRAINRIEELTSDEDVDCHFRRRGSLWVSTAPSQDAIVREPLTFLRDLDRADRAEWVSADEVRHRTGSPVSRGGIVLRDSAAVQPALLVRGLRRVALRRGVRIFEGSPMLALERRSPARVVTPAGAVTADQVVLATNVWGARIRELRRSVFVVGTQIVLTEPIPERLERLPWRDGLLLGDARFFVHYAQVTQEGRIAFGRGGGAIGPANRVTAAHFADQRTADIVARDFRRWFPELADVRLTHAWGGPVDRAPGHLPFVGSLGDHANVHYALGYSGNGVAPSALIGRILASRALDAKDEYACSPLVTGPPGVLPPEPVCSAGAVAVRSLVQRTEEQEEAGKAPAALGRLSKRLASLSLPPRAWIAPLSARSAGDPSRASGDPHRPR